MVKKRRGEDEKTIEGFLDGTLGILAQYSDRQYSCYVMVNREIVYKKYGDFPVPAGKWMDWPEEHWNLTDEEYYSLPTKERAELECKEQIEKYVFAQYDMHKSDFWNPEGLAKKWWDREGNKRFWSIEKKALTSNIFWFDLKGKLVFDGVRRGRKDTHSLAVQENLNKFTYLSQKERNEIKNVEIKGYEVEEAIVDMLLDKGYFRGGGFADPYLHFRGRSIPLEIIQFFKNRYPNSFLELSNEGLIIGKHFGHIDLSRPIPEILEDLDQLRVKVAEEDFYKGAIREFNGEFESYDVNKEIESNQLSEDSFFIQCIKEYLKYLENQEEKSSYIEKEAYRWNPIPSSNSNVRQAIKEHRHVLFDYLSLQGENSSGRLVQAHYVFRPKTGREILLSYDLDRNNWRCFWIGGMSDIMIGDKYAFNRKATIESLRKVLSGISKEELANAS